MDTLQRGAPTCESLLCLASFQEFTSNFSQKDCAFLCHKDSTMYKNANGMSPFLQNVSITLMEMTIGLALAVVNDADRFNRLIDAIRKTITCDCVALFKPSRWHASTHRNPKGSVGDSFDCRFIISEHLGICASVLPVRFWCLTAPYPILSEVVCWSDLRRQRSAMHACMGLPLLFGEATGIWRWAMQPDIFANIPARNLEYWQPLQHQPCGSSADFSLIRASSKTIKATVRRVKRWGVGTRWRRTDWQKRYHGCA